MSNKMKHVIKGIVRDHRISNPDIFHPWNSTSILNKDYLKSSFFWTTRNLGFDEAITAIFLISSGVVLIFAQGVVNWMLGIPLSLRKNNYQNKVEFIDFLWAVKTNPNTHYNALYGLYNNNPLCGLREMPKRPWISFKDPENTMMRVAVKHNREAFGI